MYLLVIDFSIWLIGSRYSYLGSKLIGPVSFEKPCVHCHWAGISLSCIIKLLIGKFFWLFTLHRGKAGCTNTNLCLLDSITQLQPYFFINILRFHLFLVIYTIYIINICGSCFQRIHSTLFISIWKQIAIKCSYYFTKTHQYC